MNRQDRIDEALESFAQAYYDEPLPPGPYLVVRTAFHGGGEVSRHKALDRAAMALLRYRAGECSCGCAEIVPASEYDELPHANESHNPYGAARP